jgi:citrate synthase
MADLKMETGWKPGLEGVVAATTRLSCVDGQRGDLILAGFPVETIAPRATFEEMLFLRIWHAFDDAHSLAQGDITRQRNRSKLALPNI